jgi:2-polyprenyl-3-methyl-5-hydroxy-6-metoxy-1,4-benzoquinol methylase
MADGLLMRAFGLRSRSSATELMDTVSLPPDVADETLRFLEMTNRRFGGTAILLRYLDEWRSAWTADKRVTVLDVGTGAADIPVALVSWARSVGVALQVTGIDLAPDVVDVARRRTSGMHEITIEREQLSDVARAGRQFDVVVASLFLHHVLPDDTVQALRDLDRAARHGVIVGDLRRSPGALAAVSLLSVVAGNAIVRHDGPLSVRRAFTVDELSRLAGDADLPYLRARPEGRFRVSLAGQKGRHA